jgi:putative transposase
LFRARVHALVMMPNHFHMLLSTPEEDIGRVMQHFMRSVTKTVNRNSGRSGRIFGARYHWSLIDTPLYYAHAFKYVYRNPVKARLVERVEDYPYSTLRSLLGADSARFALHYPFEPVSRLIPADMEPLLFWLNQAFREKHEEAIRRGLRKTVFAPPKVGWRKVLSELQAQLV